MHRLRVLSALLLIPPFLLLVQIGSPFHFSLLVALAILLCATLAHSSTGHRIPVGSGTVGAKAVSIVSAPSIGYDLPRFGYPDYMERFAWSLQSSSDLVNWTTEMTWPAGLAAGGVINIVRDGQHKFYRMQGN